MLGAPGMTNFGRLIEHRRAVLALLAKLGARCDFSVSMGLLHLQLSFDCDTTEHFRRLDAIGAQLRALGFSFRQHANGFELPYRRHKSTLASSQQLAYEIALRFRDYFSYWQVLDEESGRPRLITEEEAPRLRAQLTYTTITRDGLDVIVDGLVARDGESTLSNAVAALIPHGSEAELAALLRIVEDADQGPRAASAADAAALKAALEPLVRARWVMQPRRARTIPPDARFGSHLFGPPYALPGERWPVVAKTGRPLQCVLQIADPRVLPKGIAVLQLFYDFESHAYSTRDAGWLVKTYAKLERRRAIALDPPLAPGRFSTITFAAEDALPTWSQLKYEGPLVTTRAARAVVARCEAIDRDAAEEVFDRAAAKRTRSRDAWSFCGGYARPVQDTPTVSDRRAHFLLQLGSDDKLDLMWGDCGAIYLFHNGKTGRFGFRLQSG